MSKKLKMICFISATLLASIPHQAMAGGVQRPSVRAGYRLPDTARADYVAPVGMQAGKHGGMDTRASAPYNQQYISHGQVDRSVTPPADTTPRQRVRDFDEWIGELRSVATSPVVEPRPARGLAPLRVRRPSSARSSSETFSPASPLWSSPTSSVPTSPIGQQPPSPRRLARDYRPSRKRWLASKLLGGDRTEWGRKMYAHGLQEDSTSPWVGAGGRRVLVGPERAARMHLRDPETLRSIRSDQRAMHGDRGFFGLRRRSSSPGPVQEPLPRRQSPAAEKLSSPAYGGAFDESRLADPWAARI